jgi:hypothetical protein
LRTAVWCSAVEFGTLPEDVLSETLTFEEEVEEEEEE